MNLWLNVFLYKIGGNSRKAIKDRSGAKSRQEIANQVEGSFKDNQKYLKRNCKNKKDRQARSFDYCLFRIIYSSESVESSSHELELLNESKAVFRLSTSAVVKDPLPTGGTIKELIIASASTIV